VSYLSSLGFDYWCHDAACLLVIGENVRRTMYAYKLPVVHAYYAASEEFTQTDATRSLFVRLFVRLSVPCLRFTRNRKAIELLISWRHDQPGEQI